MTAAPLRVAFTGLAHSHPYTDAANLRAEGALVVAVHDREPAAAADFAARFGGQAVTSPAGLLAASPDVIIATPRPQDVVPTLEALAAAGAESPVFFNKTVAATPTGLADFDRAVRETGLTIGTASVLRFAPALQRLAAALRAEHVLAVRVHAQHDNAGFQLPGRSWQDDPAEGGGTLVTVGVHAWELLDVLLPGALLCTGTGWVRRAAASTTRSEDIAGIDAELRLPDLSATIPVQVLVTGLPGADRYAVEVLTAEGLHTLQLDVDDSLDALGFTGLARALLAAAPQGRAPAPWTQSATVVGNTVRGAAMARAAEGSTL